MVHLPVTPNANALFLSSELISQPLNRGEQLLRVVPRNANLTTERENLVCVVREETETAVTHPSVLT